jgi:hypothetical protein
MFPLALKTTLFGLEKSLSMSFVFLKVAFISGAVDPCEFALAVFEAVFKFTAVYAIISGYCTQAVELVVLERALICETVVRGEFAPFSLAVNKVSLKLIVFAFFYHKST